MQRFAESTDNRSPHFIPYVMAGDPEPEITTEILLMLEKEGSTMIELGVPFSDPSADGPIIQQAGERALQKGVYLDQVLEIGAQARKKGLTIPLILFTYFNPVLQYGMETLIEQTKQAGFDGFIIPDLPYEESGFFQTLVTKQGLSLIPLVAPTSRLRIEKLVKQADCFVYCVSSLGTTGVRSEFAGNIDRFLEEVRELSPVPFVVGFGISSPEHVQQFGQQADGVVIGSALVKKIEEEAEALRNESTRSQGLQRIGQFVRWLQGR